MVTISRIYFKHAQFYCLPVTFLTGDHLVKIGFVQIMLSASLTRDLGTRFVSHIT